MQVPRDWDLVPENRERAHTVVIGPLNRLSRIFVRVREQGTFRRPIAWGKFRCLHLQGDVAILSFGNAKLTLLRFQDITGQRYETPDQLDLRQPFSGAACLRYNP